MTSFFRVFNAEGRGLERIELADLQLAHWISETVLDGWRRAGARGSAPCARAAELCDVLGWSSRVDRRLAGLDEAQSARVEELLPALKATLRRDRSSWGDASFDNWWSAVGVDDARASIGERLFPDKVRQVRWVACPNPRWAPPDQAEPIEAPAALRIVEMCQAACELAGLASEANAQAKRLGELDKQPKGSQPRLLRADVKALAGARAEPCDLVAEYSGGRAFAVYFAAEPPWPRGFLTPKGTLSSRMEVARLFHDREAAAEGAARAVNVNRGVPAIVELAISALSYASAPGFEPASAPELDSVMAAREAAELERALKEARVEELEAELARRREREPKEAAPSAKGRRL